MAKAKNESTTETWIALQAAQPLVERICISPSLAGPWLAKRVFASQRVRLRWQAMRPPNTSAEIFFRSDRIPTVNFPDNSIETWESPSPESCAVGICPVTMLGVEVVREDITAQRLEELAPAPVQVLELPQRPSDASELLKPAEWLAKAMTGLPRKRAESKNTWAKRLFFEMRNYYGGETPWADWASLRRRMDDPKVLGRK